MVVAVPSYRCLRTVSSHRQEHRVCDWPGRPSDYCPTPRIASGVLVMFDIIHSTSFARDISVAAKLQDCPGLPTSEKKHNSNTPPDPPVSRLSCQSPRRLSCPSFNPLLI